jgi:predicted phosphodiesterase
VGDIVDGPGDAGRCCQLLADFGVEAVRGNHDRWALKDELRNLPDATAALDPVHRAFLEALPVTRDYATSAGPLLLCHGLAADDMNRVTPDDFGYALQANDTLQDLLHSEEYRFVVNGHTHRRMVRQLGGLTIINVGTLFREHAPCFVIIDFEVGQADFFDAPNSGVITRADRHEL